MSKRIPRDLEATVRFHGHLCPGLAIGYRAAKVGLERLRSARAEDEELIAIVENDSCAVDAVQWLTGCTFGKGNLFFRDYGKMVFTFALRPSGRAARVSLRPLDELPASDDAGRDKQTRAVLTAPAEKLFDVEDVTIELPDEAELHGTITCDRCREPVMATRVRKVRGKKLCIPCAEGGRARGRRTENKMRGAVPGGTET